MEEKRAHNFKNLLGQRFGRLTVIKFAGFSKKIGKSRWICRCDCGRITHPIYRGNLLRGYTTSCGCFRSESAKLKTKELSNNYKGGYLNAQGYHIISEKGHPNANKKGKIKRAIFVMSNKLGRPLLPGEIVHHKNGIKNDDSPKNLELWYKGHPGGQRVKDLIKIWTKDIKNIAEGASKPFTI